MRRVVLAALLVLLMGFLGAGVGVSVGVNDSDSELTGVGSNQGLLGDLGYGRELDPLPQPTDELPHYFKNIGLEPYKDPVVRARLTGLERAKLLYDVIESSVYYTQRAISKFLYKPVTRKWEIDGQPILVVFADYEHVVGEDGEYYLYRNPLGVERLTPEEFQAVEWDIYSTIYQAKVENDVLFAEVADEALERTAYLLGIPKEVLLEKMDQPVPDSPEAPGGPLTYWEVLSLPQWEADSFLPDILVFGPIYGAWGFTYLLTYGVPQVVYYDTQAHAYDWLMGHPWVLRHEFVHCHAALQSPPLGWFFDVELWNALTTNLVPEDPLNLLYHSYLAGLRTFIKAMFGYDSEARRREIWRMFAGGGYVVPDEEEWRKLDEEVRAIANEIKWQVIHTLYPIFYSDPLFWGSVNTRLCNDQSAFFAIMSQIYSPTLLSDPSGELDRAAYTAKWVAEHEDVIVKIMEKALERAGERVEDESQFEESIRALNWCPWRATLPNYPGLREEVLNRLRSGEDLKGILLDLLDRAGLGQLLGVDLRGDR